MMFLPSALAQAPVLRGYAETMYRAKSWSKLNLPGIHVLEPSPAEPRPLFARARPAFNPNCLIVADDLKVMPELLEPEVLGDMKN
jgi:hypothetical protein